MVGAEREAGGDAQVLDEIANHEANDGKGDDAAGSVAHGAMHEGERQEYRKVQDRERNGTVELADQALDGEEQDE